MRCYAVGFILKIMLKTKIMLKITELRIGNLVESDEAGITTVNAHLLLHLNSVKSLISGFVKPITLTEEWLIKFGAKQDKLERTWYLGDFEIMLPNFFVYKMDCHIRKIKYVHDFQNLYFALNGRELKVSNNNVCYKSNEACKYDCSGLCKDSA
jgi:hypothetical protein